LFGAFPVDCASSYLLVRVEEDIIQGAVALVKQYPSDRSREPIKTFLTALLERDTERTASWLQQKEPFWAKG
jgi:hypothetical protein